MPLPAVPRAVRRQLQLPPRLSQLATPFCRPTPHQEEVLAHVFALLSPQQLSEVELVSRRCRTVGKLSLQLLLSGGGFCRMLALDRASG